MALSDQDFQRIATLSRFLEWNYRLDEYQEDAIERLGKYIRKANNEILREIRAKGSKLTAFQEERALEMLEFLDSLLIPVRESLGESLEQISAEAFGASADEYYDILSWGGRLSINTIAMAPDQILSFVQNTPVGGKILREWVNSAFEYRIEKIREEIVSGRLKGESYPKLTRRIQTALGDISKQDAITLTRSYVHGSNVEAQKQLYRRNSDIIKRVQWVSALESGYFSSGRGTCPRCAGLDGEEYLIDNHPECPLHPRCRCVLLPKTLTWKELGFNSPEIEEIRREYRPYTIRENKNIDVGGRRIIKEVGFNNGNFQDFFESRPKNFKVDLIGPRRVELIEEYGLNLKDFVNLRTGELYTIQEIKESLGV